MTPEFQLEPAALADMSDILLLVADLHNAEHIEMDETARAAAVKTLIDVPEMGGIWVIRIKGTVEGYIAIAYGFSISFGGRDAFLDEICIAGEWRGQGVGGAALAQMRTILAGEDIKALHLEVNVDNHRAQRLYGQLGFEMRRQYHLMTAEI